MAASASANPGATLRRLKCLAARRARADRCRRSRTAGSGRYPEVMPETRGERIIFAIGALAIAALVALIVLQTATDRFETRHTSADAAPNDAPYDHRGDCYDAPANPRMPQTTTAPDATTGETGGGGCDPERKADVERDCRHVGRDSLWVGGRGRDLLRDPSAGHREALPQHAFVGIIRCRCEPHSALEREAAAPAAWHLQRSGRRTRAEATSRLARPCSGGKPRSRQLNNPAGGASCCPKQP